MSGNIGRRSFVKGAAALAASGSLLAGTQVLVGCSPSGEGIQTSASSDGDAVTPALCYCYNNCPVDIHTRDGKICKVMPHILPEDDPDSYTRICSKGYSAALNAYNPDRIKYPMRRVEGTERGAGEWEQLTWDEAIAEIAEKWNAYRDEFGTNSVAIWSGFGNNSFIHGWVGVGFYRFKALLSMPEFRTGADYAQIFADSWQLGSSWNYPMECLRDSKNIVILGMNPAETVPHAFRFALRGKYEHGTKFTVIDPRFTATAAQADAYLPIRPATDGALGLAVANWLIVNGKIDEDFLVNKCNAPFLVREDNGRFLRKSDIDSSVSPSSAPDYSWVDDYFTAVPTADADDPFIVWDKAADAHAELDAATDIALSGSFEIEGITVRTAYDLMCERAAEWPLEKAAEVCGLAEDDIVKLAECFVDGSAFVWCSNGAFHYTNSMQASFAWGAVLMLSGNLGKPGTGFRDPGAAAGLNPLVSSLSAPEGCAAGPILPHQAIHEIVANKTYNGEPFELKSVLIGPINALGNASGRSAFLKSLDEVEFVVDIDFWMNECAAYSDLVLPATHKWEQFDAYGGAQMPYFVYQKPPIETMFEAKNEWEIYRLITDAMGIGWGFEGSEYEVIKEAIEGAGAMTMEELEANPVVQKREIGVYEDPTFCADTGRTRLYLEDFAPRFAADADKVDSRKEALPYFEPPTEAWPETVGGYEKNALADKYPLIYFSMHDQFNNHACVAKNQWLREFSKPVVQMSPADADARGIVEGDSVKVFNDRGYVVLNAVIDTGMRPGIVNIPHGFSYEQFTEGHYQDLTPEFCDPQSANDCFTDCLCEVEKA